MAHSHGGNVVKEYSNQPGAQRIDTLVNLGTPQRPDDKMNIAKVGRYFNAFSEYDDVQTIGGQRSGLGQAFRRDPRAVNLDVSRVNGERIGHSDLHTFTTWQRIDTLMKQ